MWKSLSLLAAHQLKHRIQRSINALIFYGLAGVMGFFAVLFLLLALQERLARTLSYSASSLWVAGLCLVIALILVGIAVYVRNRRHKGEVGTAAALVAAPATLKAAGGTLGWGRILAGGAGLGVFMVLARMLHKRSD